MGGQLQNKNVANINVFLCFLWNVDYFKIYFSTILQKNLKFEIPKKFWGGAHPRHLYPLFLGLRPRFGLHLQISGTLGPWFFGICPIRTPQLLKRGCALAFSSYMGKLSQHFPNWIICNIISFATIFPSFETLPYIYFNIILVVIQPYKCSSKIVLEVFFMMCVWRVCWWQIWIQWPMLVWSHFQAVLKLFRWMANTVSDVSHPKDCQCPRSSMFQIQVHNLKNV